MKHAYHATIALCIALALSLLCLAGCESPRSVSYGRENVGYLQFVSSSSYGTVTVTLDDDVTIKAKVNSASSRVIDNDSTYAITPGAHSLEVRDKKGNLILSKQIFVSAQEIRTVDLP